MHATKALLVISLGGSLIVPDKIDVAFLRRFTSIITEHAKATRFIIVTGAGKTSRDYVAAADSLGNVPDQEKDAMGILATKLNASLVLACFSGIAHPEVESAPRKLDFDNVLVASGWKTGFSTDFCAVSWAALYGAKKVINLTNTDYLYDKDPKLHRDAKKLEKASWQQLQAIVGQEWKPSSNLPFDPLATQKAAALGMTVMLANGNDLSNFENLLDGKGFKGTTIADG
ncbi:MAG: UMP kinase [Candidatus Aenigmarchaeota archaeon]|nr:UMP kinase [Candidatus Aenigmarchaeota archaeon]